MIPIHQSMYKYVLTAIYLLIVFRFLCNIVLGDVIRFNDGREIEGRIVEKNSSHVKVATRFGTISIARCDIATIEKKPSPSEQAQQELQDLAPDDREGHIELAIRCENSKLKKLYRKVLETALERWPDDQEIRKLLGHRQQGGKWVTLEEWYQLNNFVYFKGTWYPPSELIEFKGRWIPIEYRDQQKEKRRTAVKQRQARRGDGRPWSSAETFKAGKFELESNCTRERTEKVKQILVGFLRHYQNPFVPGKIKEVIRVNLFRTRAAFLAEASRLSLPGMEHVLGFYIPSQNEMFFFDRPEDPTRFADTVRHETIHAHLDQAASGSVPRWISEGFATYFSGDPTECEAQQETGNLYLLLIEETIRTGTAPTLWDLWQSENDFFGINEYAASWAWIDLFHENPVLKSCFGRYMRIWIRDNKFIAKEQKKKNNNSEKPSINKTRKALREAYRKLEILRDRSIGHGDALLKYLKNNECEVFALLQDHIAKKIQDTESTDELVFRVLALASRAWQEMSGSQGYAAAVRASSLLERADELMLVVEEKPFWDDRPQIADRILKAKLKIAKARLVVIARLDKDGIAAPCNALIRAACGWAENAQHSAARQFHAGYDLAESVRWMIEEVECDLRKVREWYGLDIEPPSVIWHGHLARLNRELKELSEKIAVDDILYAINQFEPVVHDLASEGATLLLDATWMAPPFPDAVGELLYLALAVVPQEALDDARESLDFLLEVDPSDHAHLWAAQDALALELKNLAGEYVKKALELEPEHPAALELERELKK